MKIDERFIIAPIRNKIVPPGPIGPQGPKGDKGEKGDKGDKPLHRWDNTTLSFENPDGTWDSGVDLKGEPGGKGVISAVNLNTGDSHDLSKVTYKTSKFIDYNNTDGLSISSPENVTELSWSYGTYAHLPAPNTCQGAYVFVVDELRAYQSDGNKWVEQINALAANELIRKLEASKWIDFQVDTVNDKVQIDMKSTFVGMFDTIDQLNTSTEPKVENQSFAIVKFHPSAPTKIVNGLYVYKRSGWEPSLIHGQLIRKTNDTIDSFDVVKAGTNITIDYDSTDNSITLNSTGGGATPTDLSEYVKGVQVHTKYAGDWTAVEWDEVNHILSVGTEAPKYDKLASVIKPGDNIRLTRDADDNLVINADAHVDMTQYVLGAHVTSANGITAAFSEDTQGLSIGYEPSFEQVNSLLESGDGILLTKGSGSKVNISSNVVLPDLTPYLRKDQISIPTDYWGTVKTTDAVELQIKPTAQQFMSMFDVSTSSDLMPKVIGNKVAMTVKDGRKRIFNLLTETNVATGKPPLLKAGPNINFGIDKAQQVITIDSISEFGDTSIAADMPLVSTWNADTKVNTLSFSVDGFVGKTDVDGDVALINNSGKITYKIDKTKLPYVSVKKGVEQGALSEIDFVGDLSMVDMVDDSGRKKITLTMPTIAIPTSINTVEVGSSNKISINSDVAGQVVFSDGTLSFDFAKGYFDGFVNDKSKMPANAVLNHSYCYLVDDYIMPYRYVDSNWQSFRPIGSMLLSSIEDGKPVLKQVTQIKNTSAVSIDSSGELSFNASGIVYSHGGVDKPLHSLSVEGPGVAANYDDASQKLSLVVTGGSTAASPLKLTAKHQDGALAEYSDVRELIFEGDADGIKADALVSGGVKVTIPSGVIVEGVMTPTELEAKYRPSYFKGKFVFCYDQTDDSNSAWYCCDGIEWYQALSKDMVGIFNSLAVRYPDKIPEKAIDSIKDQTLIATTNISGLGRGFIFNMVSTGGISKQIFYPFDSSASYHRRFISTWTEWEVSDDVAVEIAKHNAAEDAHDALIRPCCIATTSTTYKSLYDGVPIKQQGNLPMYLMYDNTGHCFTSAPRTEEERHVMIVPKSGEYKITWAFQLTMLKSKDGHWTFEIFKNDISIATKQVNAPAIGNDFPTYIITANSVFDKGDELSVTVKYSNAALWTDGEKEIAEIDAVKNYVAIEHKDSKSASQIANSWKMFLTGINTKPGYEARVYKSQTSGVEFVEVVGGKYNTTIQE